MKDIPNYEGLYAATEDGHIWSYPKSKHPIIGRYLKEQLQVTTHNRIRPHNQLVVSLWKNRKREMFLVHRLIAATFIQNLENKSDINHKDGNPLNNEISNLEWCSKKENMKHAIDTGLFNQYTH